MSLWGVRLVFCSRSVLRRACPVANDPKSASPHPFDVTTIEHLINLMSRHELTEIALQEGEQRIRLRKGGDQPVVYAAAPQAVASVAASASAAATQAAAPAKKLHEIKSVMVGGFYLKPKPDAADFVKVGQTIQPDTTVCLIEAMKIFNEIKAECSGTIAEICVKNGDSVDFGTVLFRVEAS